LRDHVDELSKANAQPLAVGFGPHATAVLLVAEMRLSFPIWIDADRALYRALDARRAGLSQILTPKVFAAARRAFRQGFRQGKAEGDSRQLGGTFLIDRSGEVHARRPSRFAGDNPPWDWIRSALAEIA
jgi:peroxiredoxin